MELDVRVTKTFYDWCMENNRMDLNDRFDEEKNACTTKDIGYQSNLKFWFKCPKGLHESEQTSMYVVTRNVNNKLACHKCNSLAQFIIDKFGEDYLWKRWRNDNELNPWNISHGSRVISVKLQCAEKEYHQYEQIANSFSSGSGCPYCAKKIIHPNDSLGAIIPDIIERWSEKNEKSPFEYFLQSEDKVWLKCPNGKHNDYLQQIKNAHQYGYKCPECSLDEQSERMKGEGSPFWKGGITEEYKLLRKRRDYAQWRTSVYERDNYTCQCCGSSGGRLNAHHLHSFAKYPELRLDVDNGITLCTKCHDTTEVESLHYVYGTHNITPDMLRQYILDKSNKDIYITNPNLLYKTPLLPSNELEFN